MKKSFSGRSSNLKELDEGLRRGEVSPGSIACRAGNATKRSNEIVKFKACPCFKHPMIARPPSPPFHASQKRSLDIPSECAVII